MAYTKKKARPANRKKYFVRLSADEREELTQLVGSKRSQELRQRAAILLKADEGEHGSGGWTDELIAEALGCSVKTVERTRKRFVLEGLKQTLERKKYPTPHRPRKLDGEAEAKVIALAKGPPPEGRARWTYRLLADKVVELKIVPSISHKTIWATLKKMNFGLT